MICTEISYNCMYIQYSVMFCINKNYTDWILVFKVWILYRRPLWSTTEVVRGGLSPQTYTWASGSLMLMDNLQLQTSIKG